MLVAVACGKCGKPFQVDEPAVGTSVECPWCKASVLALPVATPTANAAQPLSLDQAVQLPSDSAEPRKPLSRGKLLVRLFLLAVAMVAACAVGWVASQYGSGRIPEGAWREVEFSDGNCKVKLPGTPVEEPFNTDARFPGILGGKRHVVHRRFEQVDVGVGWLDLDPLVARTMHDDSLIAYERERRAVELGGKATVRGSAQVDGFPAEDVEYDTPNGPVYERLVAALNTPRPRLYVVTVGGPKQTLKGEAGKKTVAEIAFSSLWLNDKAKR
jgi:DNA-directed RNA polymerase subunit RPC12/RpoP